MSGSEFSSVLLVVNIAVIIICGPSSTMASPADRRFAISLDAHDRKENGSHVININYIVNINYVINLNNAAGRGPQGGTVTFYRYINFEDREEDIHLSPGSCVNLTSLNNDARSVKMNGVNCIRLFDDADCVGIDKVVEYGDDGDFGDWRDLPSSVRLCGSRGENQTREKVIFYRHADYTDRWEELTVSSSCANLNSLNNDARSIRLNGMSCVRLFDDPNCTGPQVDVRPDFNDKDFGSFRDKPSSIRLC